MLYKVNVQKLALELVSLRFNSGLIIHKFEVSVLAFI